MKRPRVLGSSAIRGVLASFILIGCASANGAELRAATEKVSAMSVSEREALEHRINVIANDVANARPFLYEDRLPIHIEASFDPVSESLIMHTDERLGPSSGSPDVEDMRHAVDQTIWPLLESIPSFRGIDWRYGGKDIYFWYPQDRVHQNRQSRRASRRVSGTRQPSACGFRASM